MIFPLARFPLISRLRQPLCYMLCDRLNGPDTFPKDAHRQQDIRIPTVVFASDIDVEERKVKALSLGAADYCFTFGALFSRIESIFAPASATG